ncbi:MAG: AAA family ATPase [Alphaproteobacteria bacterium]
MNTEDQSEVIGFLTERARARDRQAERIDTHAAHIFLSADEAWKLKRAVWYPFMDLSDAARRHDCCVAEVELNRRTAPDIYLGVCAITRESGGGLAIDGGGAVVDWFVRMRRFDQAGLLDRLADAGALALDAMAMLAAEIAAFHAAAKARPDKGGAEALRWIVDDNCAEFREMPALVASEKVAALEAASHAQLDRVGALLDARRASGFVRRCHGDLHLRNVVMIDGRPTLFDCIEFSDDIACIDVLYDVAFMLMDLWVRGLKPHANALFNGYMAATDQFGGLAALPLFLSARAAIRAKVLALEAAADGGDADGHGAEIARYLDLAESFARPAPPRLVAVGGLSGSGKSTLARALAPGLGPAPGAVVLRSDVARKHLFGVDPAERLPQEAYAPAVSARVYGLLMDRAAQCLAEGQAVVVDAVFDRPADRAAVAGVAADLGLPFAGFWLQAPEAVLTARVGARRGDASDADAAVVRRQLKLDTGEIAWARLDAARPAAEVAAQARMRLVDTLA